MPSFRKWGEAGGHWNDPCSGAQAQLRSDGSRGGFPDGQRCRPVAFDEEAAMPIRMLARSICLVGLLFPAAVLAQGAPPPPKVTVAKPILKDVVEQDDFIGRFE